MDKEKAELIAKKLYEIADWVDKFYEKFGFLLDEKNTPPGIFVGDCVGIKGDILKELYLVNDIVRLMDGVYSTNVINRDGRCRRVDLEELILRESREKREETND